MNSATFGGFDFTYTIKSMSIEFGTLVIEFDPVDPDLLPITLNCNLLEKPFTLYNGAYTSQDEVPFADNLQYTVEISSPVAVWRRQRMMIDNMDLISSKM